MSRTKLQFTPSELRERTRAWVLREFDRIPLSVVECYAEKVGLGKASCA